MKTKIIIPLLLFFFLLSNVFAVSPFTQLSTSTNGLEIEYPQYDEVLKDTSFDLHIHVFNKSNGVLMTNTTTSCLVHLYNITGNHILQSPLEFSTNNIDYEVFIAAGNFSQISHYAYIIQCNTSNSGGFASGNFDIVTALDKGQDVSYFGLLLIPLVLAGLFFYISNFLGENHTPLKWFLLLLGFVTTLGSFRIGVSILTESKTAVINMLGTYTYIFGMVLYIIIAYFLLNFIYIVFMLFKDKK